MNNKLIKVQDNFFNRNNREEIISEFKKIPLSEVRTKMKIATQNIAREWKYNKGNENINTFYSQTDGYIFELEDWHISDKMKQAGMIILSSQTKNKRILEYGCGIADTSILASLSGAKEIHALDLPSITLDYARFRSKKFNINNQIVFIESSKNINDLVLPEKHYDIIIAEDVFEHVEHPISHAQKIYSALKYGGKLYFSTEFIHSDFHPMHLKSNEKFHGISWLYELEKIGYKIKSPCEAIK